MHTHAVTTVQCRETQRRYRGRLWIHTAKQPRPLEPPGGWDHWRLWLPGEPLPRGVILGSVELVDCVEESHSPWAFHEYAYKWVLRHPKLLVRTGPHVGKLGFAWRRPPPGQVVRARRNRPSYAG